MSKTPTEPIGVCWLGVTVGSTRRSPGLATEARLPTRIAPRFTSCIRMGPANGCSPKAVLGGALSPELSWSPDGNQIAFTRPPFPYVRGSDGTERANTAEPDLYVISTDGSGELRLGLGKGPVWSPDGGRIAFIRGRVVYAIDSDGSGERRLGRGDYHLSWSPDGTQIAVRRDFGRPSPGKFGGLARFGKRAIWVWNVDGSGGRQIWPRQGLCECGHPAWQPG